MQIAIIADVHGNFEAVDSVTEAADHLKADRIVCLGDIYNVAATAEAITRAGLPDILSTRLYLGR